MTTRAWGTSLYSSHTPKTPKNTDFDCFSDSKKPESNRTVIKPNRKDKFVPSLDFCPQAVSFNEKIGLACFGINRALLWNQYAGLDEYSGPGWTFVRPLEPLKLMFFSV